MIFFYIWGPKKNNEEEQNLFGEKLSEQDIHQMKFITPPDFVPFLIREQGRKMLPTVFVT